MLLETRRLVLRRYGDSDASGILELVRQNRAGLIQNFSQMAAGLSREEEARSFVQDKAELWNAGKSFCYGIWRQAAEGLIGQLQVKNIVWNVPSAELSYFIGNSFQRQGFATEAVSAMLHTAFEQFDFEKIFVRIIPSNKESISLAKKLGFKHEGLHRKEFRCGFGELHDVHYFSLTKDDFRTGATNV